MENIEGSFNQDSSVFVNNSKLVFWGRGSNSQYSAYILEGAVATKVFTPINILERRHKYFEDALYYIDNTDIETSKLVKLDLTTSTVSAISELSVRYANLLTVDEKVFIGYDTSSYRDQLGEVSGNVIIPYIKNATTGSSIPYNFVEANGSTYFLADDGVNGREVWTSNGYNTELLLETIEGNESGDYKLIKLGDSVLASPKAYNGGKVWLIKNKELEEVGEISYLPRDYTRVGDSVFFVGEFMGDYTRDLGVINESGLSKIARRVLDRLHNVGTGVIYTEYGSSTDEYFYSDGVNTKTLETNGVNVTNIQLTFGEKDSDYYVIAGNAQTATKSIFHFSEENGLQELDYDLSGYHYLIAYTNENDTVIRLEKDDYSSQKLVRLDGLQIEDVDISTLPNTPYLIYLSDNRMYFEVADKQSFDKSFYFYENNNFTQIDWNLEENLQVANRDVNNGVEWVISYNDIEGSHFLLSNDGTNVEYVGKVQTESPLLESIEAADGVLLRFGRRIENSELAYITEDGTVSFLSDGQDFHWGGFDSSSQPFMGKGHGKWFFMRGCTAAYGCEPYSMNLNQFPTAKFTSEASYYSGQEVVLDASITEDPDGDILEYHWVQLSGPEVDFESIEGESIAFKAPEVDVAEEVVIELNVVDDGYDKDITSRSFKVMPNSAPVISIDAPQSATEGSTVTLDASGTVDNEGEGLSFNWSVDNGGITLSKQTEAVTSFDVPSISSNATAKITLTVTDASGHQSVKSIDIELLKNATGGNEGNGSSGGSGGGSTGLILLLLLCTIYLKRTYLK